MPHEYLEECETLSDEEFGRLMRALLRYSRDGEVIEFPGNERFFARRMMHQEDMFKLRYEESAAKRRERAEKAAAARWGEKQAQAIRMLEHL